MQRVLITGATGLVGQEIVKQCHDQKIAVNYLSTSKAKLEDKANYKGFYLDTQFNYTIGVDRYDFDYSGYIDPTNIGQFRHSRDILDAWQQAGDITNIPSLNATNLSDGDFSDRFIRDSDYVRLRFIQFGYNVPKKYTDQIGFSFVKLFGSAENLVTWSKWRGFDAEGVGSSQYEYPTPRTFSIGVEFGF